MRKRDRLRAEHYRVKTYCIDQYCKFVCNQFPSLKYTDLSHVANNKKVFSQSDWKLYKDLILKDYNLFKKNNQIPEGLKNYMAPQKEHRLPKPLPRIQNGNQKQGISKKRTNKRKAKAEDYIWHPIPKLLRAYHLSLQHINKQFRVKYTEETIVTPGIYAKLVDLIVEEQKMSALKKTTESNLTIHQILIQQEKAGKNSNRSKSTRNSKKKNISKKKKKNFKITEQEKPTRLGLELQKAMQIAKKKNQKPPVPAPKPATEATSKQVDKRNLVPFKLNGAQDLKKWDLIEFHNGYVLFKYRASSYCIQCESSQKVMNQFKAEYRAEGLSYNVMFKQNKPTSIILPDEVQAKVSKLSAGQTDIDKFSPPLTVQGQLSNKEFNKAIQSGSIKTNDYIHFLYQHQNPIIKIQYYEEDTDDFSSIPGDFSLLFTIENSDKTNTVIWESTRHNTATYCFKISNSQDIKSFLNKLGKFITDASIENRRYKMKRRVAEVVKYLGHYTTCYHEYNSVPDHSWRSKVKGLGK